MNERPAKESEVTIQIFYGKKATDFPDEYESWISRSRDKNLLKKNTYVESKYRHLRINEVQNYYNNHRSIKW